MHARTFTGACRDVTQGHVTVRADVPGPLWTQPTGGQPREDSCYRTFGRHSVSFNGGICEFREKFAAAAASPNGPPETVV